MGDIENDVEFIHFAEQFSARLMQGTRHPCSIGVPPGTVMRRSKSAQAISIRPVEVVERDQRIRSLQAEYIADWLGAVWRILVFPQLYVAIQLPDIGDLHHFAFFFHGPVPG